MKLKNEELAILGAAAVAVWFMTRKTPVGGPVGAAGRSMVGDLSSVLIRRSAGEQSIGSGYWDGDTYYTPGTFA